MIKLFIASDHAGTELKAALQKGLPGFKWEDLGPSQSSPSVDYPDFAKILCEKLLKTTEALGLLICGSGIGMSIAANKINGIRAALVDNPVSAKFARSHNHANVLCLGARFCAAPYALEIVQAFLDAKPGTEKRHTERVKKISKLER